MDFWARRKAAVEAEAQQAEVQQAQEVAAAREAALAEKTDEELLEELGLPEPESLGPEDDFKAFLSDGVPQRLKTRALRCLWRSNPILANVDGLVDYGEDFTDASCVVENLQTAYQVGKGMLAHVEELARQAEAKTTAAQTTEHTEAETVTQDAVAEEGDAAPEQTAVADATNALDHSDEVALPSEVLTAPSERGDLAPDEDAFAAPPRRRMAFTFDETPARTGDL